MRRGVVSPVAGAALAVAGAIALPGAAAAQPADGFYQVDGRFAFRYLSLIASKPTRLPEKKVNGEDPDATDGVALQKLLAEMYATPMPVQERFQRILAP